MTDERAASLLKEQGDRPLRLRSLPGIMDAIADAIAKAFAPLKARVAALERGVDQLKGKGPNLADCYRGAWMLGAYRRGELVTMSGSLFLALADTEEKPGSGACWKMIVKRGSDGKDLR